MSVTRIMRLSKSRMVCAILITGILIPFVMNAVWAAGGYEVFYWSARFILDLEKLFVGIVFIALPFISLSEKDNNKVHAISWVYHLLAIIFGIAILAFGFQDIKILTARWVQECATIIECIK